MADMIKLLDVAPGQMVQWRAQVWIVAGQREPSHALAGAHGARVVDVDVWLEAPRHWHRSPITVWPDDEAHWDCYVLDEATQELYRRTLVAAD